MPDRASCLGFALAAGDPVQRKNIGTITDFLHRRTTQVITQFWVTSQNDGQPSTAVFNHFHQPLEPRQGITVQVMRLINKQCHRTLTLSDQFLQFPLAAFTLFGDLHLLILRQIVKQGVNQRGEPGTLIAACKELNAYSIGLSDVKLFGLIKDPSSRRGNLQVNGGNIHSLYQIAGSDHNSRTLEMFTGAGILHKDILIEEFDTVNEDVLTRKIIDKQIDALDIWEKGESSIIEMESSVHEAFSTLKSDTFITEWLHCGYSTKEEHRSCISMLGEYINFQH